MRDVTFTGIAHRAARFPIIMRKGQMPKLRLAFTGTTDHHLSETERWLLLNTLQANRLLGDASPGKT